MVDRWLVTFSFPGKISFINAWLIDSEWHFKQKSDNVHLFNIRKWVKLPIFKKKKSLNLYQQRVCNFNESFSYTSPTFKRQWVIWHSQWDGSTQQPVPTTRQWVNPSIFNFGTSCPPPINRMWVTHHNILQVVSSHNQQIVSDTTYQAVFSCLLMVRVWVWFLLSCDL